MLDAVDASSANHEVGIAPRSLRIPFHITGGNVHASYEGHFTVDDNQLAVIAIVHLAGEGRKFHWEESVDVDTFATHTLIEAVVNVPAAHVIVDDPHLYALPGFVDEGICDETSQFVVGEDVALDVDALLCLSDLLQQRPKERIAIGVDFHLIVLEGQSTILIVEKVDQVAVLLSNLEVFLLGVDPGLPLRQLVEGTLRNVALPTDVLTEKDVEHDADERQKGEHKKPCHGLRRLSVIHQHGDHHRDDDGDVCYKKQPMKIDHVSKQLFKSYKFVSLQAQLPGRMLFDVGDALPHDRRVALPVAGVARLQIIMISCNAISVHTPGAVENEFQFITVSDFGHALGRHTEPIKVFGRLARAIALHGHKRKTGHMECLNQLGVDLNGRFASGQYNHRRYGVIGSQSLNP